MFPLEEKAIELSGIPRKEFMAYESLCVHPDLQKKGIGSKLLGEIMQQEKKPIIIGCMEEHLVKYY